MNARRIARRQATVIDTRPLFSTARRSNQIISCPRAFRPKRLVRFRIGSNRLTTTPYSIKCLFVLSARVKTLARVLSFFFKQKIARDH